MNPTLLKLPLRWLRREPVTAVVTVLILALSTGAAALIFTMVDAVLLDPLPFAAPERLVQLESEQGGARGELSMRELRDIDELTDLFSEVAAYRPPLGGYTMGGVDGPVQAPAVLITHNLFAVLGVQPEIGSSFPAVYDRERSFGIVMSHRLYLSQFGGDKDQLEEVLTLDGAPNYTVFGVMPPDFDFPARSDLYRSIYINERNPNLDDRSARSVLGVARLAEGQTLATARARLAALSQQLAEEFPETNRGVQLQLRSLDEVYTGDLSAYLWILSVGVAALLAIGCINTSNLLLARALPRQKIFALQAALGASRGRQAWQILAESVFLCAAGAALGLLLAQLGLGALRQLLRFDLPGWMVLQMDSSTVLFLILLALATALLASSLPISYLARAEASEALRAGRRGTGNRGQRRLSRILVTTQVVLATVLSAGTAALLESSRSLSKADFGFQPEQLSSFKVNLPWFLYSRREPAKLDAFHRDVLAGLQSLPAVEAAALTSDLPFTPGAGGGARAYVTFGQDPADIEAHRRLRQAAVSPSLMEVLGIPLLDGRNFSPDDRADTLPVAILSQRAAQLLWPGESPLGKSLRVVTDVETPWRQVIGVVGNVQREVVASSWTESPSIYVPASQNHPANVHYVVRTRGVDPTAMAQELRHAVQRVDPLQPIWDVATMPARLDLQLWRERAVTTLVSAFSLVAILLAAAGLYALLAHAVRQRQHELGVRMALGADARRIASLVLGESGRLLLPAIALGGLITLGLLRWFSSFMPFLAVPSFPFLAGTVGALLALAVLATLLPARQASNVDPARTLGRGG